MLKNLFDFQTGFSFYSSSPINKTGIFWYIYMISIHS